MKTYYLVNYFIVQNLLQPEPYGSFFNLRLRPRYEPCVTFFFDNTDSGSFHPYEAGKKGISIYSELICEELLTSPGGVKNSHPFNTYGNQR